MKKRLVFNVKLIPPGGFGIEDHLPIRLQDDVRRILIERARELKKP